MEVKVRLCLRPSTCSMNKFITRDRGFVYSCTGKPTWPGKLPPFLRHRLGFDVNEHW